MRKKGYLNLTANWSRPRGGPADQAIDFLYKNTPNNTDAAAAKAV